MDEEIKPNRECLYDLAKTIPQEVPNSIGELFGGIAMLTKFSDEARIHAVHFGLDFWVQPREDLPEERFPQ